MQKAPPWFIVLEGIDGSGTTTQAARLTKYLTDRGVNTVSVFEPSSAFLGPVLRSILKMEEGWEVPYAKENKGAFRTMMALLFSADRVDHCYRQINPLLDEGTTVVCDRYWLSTLAYQTPGVREVGFVSTSVWLNTLRRHCLLPDVTFLLDLHPEDALKRVEKRGHGNVEIYETLETQKRVAENYRYFASKYQDSDVVIHVSASGSEDDVYQELKGHVNKLFGAWLT